MLSHALAVVAVSWRSAVPAVAAGGVIFGRFVMPHWLDMFFCTLLHSLNHDARSGIDINVYICFTNIECGSA